MMLGTKFVGDKIKEGRENRRLKREEQERTQEARTTSKTNRRRV